jgi:hypothetical protein
LNDTPGLSCSNSSTVKAGASLMRSPLTVVMVCPGGFGSAPGVGRDSAGPAAGAAADGDGDGGDVADWTTAGAGGRAAAIARGRGACETRLGFGGVTTTSGTRTGEAGAATAGALGSAGAGADWLASGFGASVDSPGGADGSWLRPGDSAGGADESCVRPGTGTSMAPMRTRAKGDIGRWSRVSLRARRKAVFARRPAAIGVNAASGLKLRGTDTTRFEMAALLHARKSRMG